MLFKRAIFAFLLAFPLIGFAQHCRWDNAYMFAIKVTDSTGKPIDNLRITLFDTIGNPFVYKFNSHFYESLEGSYAKNDTLIFKQNLDEIKDPLNDGKTRPLKMAGRNYFVFFPFASEQNESKRFGIKIEDPLKRYYTSNEEVDYDRNLINLCADKGNYTGKMPTFTLTKRAGYSFHPLKIIAILTDKKQIAELKHHAELPLHKSFFVGRYVDKQNTNLYALFEKKGSKCIVYQLAYFEFLNENFSDSKYLMFTNGYNSGGAGNSQSEAYFVIVDLKKRTSLSFRSLNYSETWDPRVSGDGEILKCESTVKFHDNILSITKTCTENFEQEEDCIDSGEYKITEEKLVKIK